MATIRRNKYGKIHYAKLIAGTTIFVLTDDPAAAAEVDEATARAIVDAHKARNSPASGQLAALDAKGKTISLWGEPGEPPAPPKPVASLPGLAGRVEKLEERVEMIEAADGTPIAERTTITMQFTADEATALKGMLAEWTAHKQAAATKDKNERKEQMVRGEQKSPVNTAATAPAAPAG